MKVTVIDYGLSNLLSVEREMCIRDRCSSSRVMPSTPPSVTPDRECTLYSPKAKKALLPATSRQLDAFMPNENKIKPLFPHFVFPGGGVISLHRAWAKASKPSTNSPSSPCSTAR